MSVGRISPQLQKILHSLANRVPKIVLHRAEDVFPALNTSLTVFVPEEADFDSRQEMGHMSELQNNLAQHEMYKDLCTHSEEQQSTNDVHKNFSMRRYVSKKHLQSHHEEQAVACDVCRKLFKCPSALKLHVCSYTGEKLLPCDNEKFKCAPGHSVTRRMLGAAEIHGGSQQTASLAVREPLAGPSTSGADKIVPVSSHSDIKHIGMYKSSSIGLQRTVGKFICKHCGNIFETFVEFELHVKTHFSEKPFTCVCGRSYMHKGHLKEHVLTHTDWKPHVCTQCGKSFAHKCDLTMHTRIHTGEKPYSCTECGKSFVQGGQLKMHMRTHTGEKPYSCSVCGKSFVQKHNMLDHMFLHIGIKPYSCTLCGRSFVQGCHLKDHMKTHSGEKPYLCSFCGKSFSQNSDLRVHLRGHTGEKPFNCTECGKNFARSGVLKRHIVTHSGEKPYKCSLCGKEYTQSHKLKRHMMIHHNKKEITPETPKVILLPSLCSREGLQNDSNAESSVLDKKESNSKEYILPH